MRLRALVRVGCVAFLMGGAAADADVSFALNRGDKSALASFSVAGGTLTVTLWNTSAVDPTGAGDVLTGLFFDIANFDGSLTKESALLATTNGTPVLYAGETKQPGTGYNSYAGPGDVGSEAGYRNGAAAEQTGVGDHAIGMVAMDGFMGDSTRFDTDKHHNLQGPKGLGGIEYGLVNATFGGGAGEEDSDEGDGGSLGTHDALIAGGVVYTFGDFSGSVGDISNVSFNYGTEFNPVTVPAPSAAMLGMIGLGTLCWVRRRPA